MAEDSVKELMFMGLLQLLVWKCGTPGMAGGQRQRVNIHGVVVALCV